LADFEIKRIKKFLEVPGLDTELNLIIKQITNLLNIELGKRMKVTVGTTQERPKNLTISDRGKVSFYDLTTEGLVFWKGRKWSDE